jgi:hypothetical protein
MRTDAVADGQNRVEVVVVNRAGNLAISLGLNYSEFPNSSRRVEFTILENALQVLIDGRHRDLEQSRDQPLWKPDRFMRQSHFDPRLAVFSLVKDELAGIVRRRCGEVLCHGDSFPVRFCSISWRRISPSPDWLLLIACPDESERTEAQKLVRTCQLMNRQKKRKRQA